MSRRERISNATKLAAALCVILEIPHEHQLLMTAEQILSLVNWDHWPIRRDDGLALGMSVADVDRFSNLFPKPILGHREKTAKIDQPQMAKSRHLRNVGAEHRAALAVKAGDQGAADAALRTVERKRPKRRHRWASRAIQSRPMSSRRQRR